MPTVHTAETHDCEYDVVVVGGGPAGCSAGIFTARDGLDTLVFDRGRSSIQRCAHLENYLGFPAGIDVETLYALAHDHVGEAGCERRDDLVEDVARREPTDTATGFVVTPQEGNPVTARRVIAATRYDGEYLRGLDDDDAMIECNEYDSEEVERFDREYADRDGSTPVPGLYVASPAAETDRQAIIAAGRGARVGLAVVEAARLDQGYPEAVVNHYDWLRRDAERTGEWADRDRWREWFDEKIPDDHDVDADRLAELRETAIDVRLDSYVDDDEIERRRDRGHERLADHLDDDRILDAVDDERVLARAREIEAARADVDGSDAESPDVDGHEAESADVDGSEDAEAAEVSD